MQPEGGRWNHPLRAEKEARKPSEDPIVTIVSFLSLASCNKQFNIYIPYLSDRANNYFLYNST